MGGVLAEHSAAIILGNTVIAGNLNGANATTTNGTDVGAVTSGRFTSLGGNFIGDTSPVTITPVLNDHFYTGNGPDPGLLPLAANGGTLIGDPRAAVVLPTISDIGGTQPLVDTGDPDASVTTDERGFTRPDLTSGGSEGSLPDVGAFEAQDTTLTLTVTESSPAVAVGGVLHFLITVTNFGTTPLPLDNSTVTFTFPVNVTVISPTGAGVTATTVTVPLSALAVGAGQSFAVTVAGVSAGTGLTAVATVSSPDATAVPGSSPTFEILAQPVVVGEFSNGVNEFVSGQTWTLLTLNNIHASVLAVGANGTIVGDFSNGVNVYDSGTTWTLLTAPNVHASLLAVDAEGHVFGEFSNGVNEFIAGTTWQLLTVPGVHATLLTAGSFADVAAEFPGYGVLKYISGTTWAPLNASLQADATALAMNTNGDVVGQFAGLGVQEFLAATGVWQPLSPPGSATLLGNDSRGNVGGAFPGTPPSNVWRYNIATGTWQPFSFPVPIALAMDDAGDLFAGFNHTSVEEISLSNATTQVTQDGVFASLLAAS